MKKRGRKSSAELAIAPVTKLVKLPKPPMHLSEKAADTWRMVMSSKAAKMISPEAYPVLVEYCRSVEQSDRIAAQVERFKMDWIDDDEGLKRLDKLLSMLDRLTRAINSCAVKLRLTPSTRFHSETAATVINNTTTGHKPWD